MRLSESLAALLEVARNPPLRRLQLASAATNIAGWTQWVAVAVFLYEQGGTAALGAVGFARMLAPALAVPFLSLLADRYRRARVMAGANLLVAISLALSALAVLSGAPAATVYLLAVVLMLAHSAYPPAQAALLPSLAQRPEQLTAANVVSSTIESLSIFVGPALGGALLLVLGIGETLAVTAAAFLVSALLVARISEPRRERGAAEGIRRQLAAGFTTVAKQRDVRLLVGLFAAQTLVGGILSVLLVVVALDLLEIGRGGVGLLNSAVGAGGLLGALVAGALIARARLASDLAFGLLLWGLPLVVLALWPTQAVAIVLLVLMGLGNTLVDVSGFTLLQRGVAEEVLARVFGVLESLILASLALGALLAPLLVAAIGTRGALAASGAFLPLLAALSWRRLRAIDAASPLHAEERALLRAIPIFAPLAAATLEALASALRREHVSARTVVVRQDEPGDRFYVIAEGELDVVVDGKRAEPLSAGDYFGEIALLRGVPRTATVLARTNAELFSLDRNVFIAAVTGHAETAELAEAVIARRLAVLRPALASH